MIKVNYDAETTLVKGYYPDSINYASIPEPFIEIEDDAQILDRQMCVIKGVYQEYAIPNEVLLKQGQETKISQCKDYLSKTDWQIIAFVERKRSIDQDVVTNRSLAVSLQAEINACKTLAKLNAININFE